MKLVVLSCAAPPTAPRLEPSSTTTTTIRTKPDLVLLHETNLRPTQPVKVRGYACIACDRLTPRGSTDTVKGGGVMILVKSEGDRPLPYSQLPPLPEAPTDDNTTEAVGVRLHILGSSLDVHSLYVPPLQSGAAPTCPPRAAARLLVTRIDYEKTCVSAVCHRGGFIRTSRFYRW